jgi:hypothetical protein
MEKVKFKDVLSKHGRTSIQDYLYLRNKLKEFGIQNFVNQLYTEEHIDENNNIYPDNDAFSLIIHGINENLIDFNDIIDDDEFLIVKKNRKNERNQLNEYYNKIQLIEKLGGKPNEKLLENKNNIEQDILNRHYSFLVYKNPHWSTGNILTFGMDPLYDIHKSIKLLKRMKKIAEDYVKQKKWSKNTQFFFHIHPHNSIETLHLHIIDPDYENDSYQFNLKIGITIDNVICALESIEP